MDYKKSTAPQTTVTRDIQEFSKETNNIYETVMIIAKRANQIGQEMKKDLEDKLEEFSTVTDNLEEVFENREQIEISKYYEKMPKPSLIAIKEFEDGEIYYRNPAHSVDEELEMDFND